MTKPVSSAAYTFATQTSTIPLSYLDTNFGQVISDLNDLNNYSNYVADTGTANNIVLNYPSGITTSTIATGCQLQFICANTNTGSVSITVQVNGSTILASTVLLTEAGAALTSGTLSSGAIYGVIYNGTNWILTGTGATGTGAVASGAIYINSNNITTNYTFPSGYNGESVGPITIATGNTVTVTTGCRWVIL